jgi:hypothetical protein
MKLLIGSILLVTQVSLARTINCKKYAPDLNPRDKVRVHGKVFEIDTDYFHVMCAGREFIVEIPNNKKVEVDLYGKVDIVVKKTRYGTKTYKLVRGD